MQNIYLTLITHTNNETNSEILHTISKSLEPNTTEQYEMNKHYKQSPTNILNDQLHYTTHRLFDSIIHVYHINITATQTNIKWKMNPTQPVNRDYQALIIVHMAPKSFC